MVGRLKIAVCGASKGDLRPEILEKAEEIGKLVAKSGQILLTGACTGYPQKAAEGAKVQGGFNVGFSPGNNWTENANLYTGLDYGLFDLMIYTGLGEGRNFVLVKSADICIFMGKGSGTLMELTIALKHGKKIGILTGSGGIDEIIDQVLDLSWDEYPPIVRDSDPAELVRRLML